MEQLTLFSPPFKYIIDTSSLLSQKPDQPHRKIVYRSLWDRVEQYMEDRLIVTCSEIFDEIKDKPIRDWLKDKECIILPIDDFIQRNVIRIVTEYPKMIEFTGGSGSSSGDVFLIATAMKYGLIIITEENPKKENKIPKVCKTYGLEAINLTDLSNREGWVF